MAKPASGPVEWATDATVSSGPEAGSPTRVDPAGVASQGWLSGKSAPARWMNWVLGVLGDWTSYLDNLPNETDFTGEDFAWGGEHTFNDLVTISGGMAIPSGLVTNGLLTNNGIGLGGTNDEVLYADGVGVATPRSRTVLVPLSLGQISANITAIVTGVLVAMGQYWTWPVTSGQVVFPISLLAIPRGAKLVSVRIGVSNQSGGTANMGATLIGKSADKLVPANTAGFDVGTGGASAPISSATSAIITVISSIGTITFDNSVAEYYIAVDGQVDCRIHWVEVNYLDPGPRNG